MKKIYSAPSVQRYALYQKDGVLATTSLPMDTDGTVDGDQALVKEENITTGSIWDKEW